MSEAVYGDDSTPPTVGSGFGSLEVEIPETCEILGRQPLMVCSYTVPFGDLLLIAGSDMDFNQNHGEAGGFSDDDLPSVRDILGCKKKPEVIDLVVDDDAVGVLNNKKVQISDSHRTQVS